MDVTKKLANIHHIVIENPKDDDHTYSELQKLYTRQELADRLEGLYAIKHEIEYAMSKRKITSYETKKFADAVYSIQWIMSELLRDFKSEKEEE